MKTNATLSSSGGPVGSVTATCGGAEDVAGNANGAAVTYDVVYALGRLLPADRQQRASKTRGNSGRTIPASSSLGGGQGLDILASGSPTSVQVAYPASAPLDTLEESSTATVSALKYDPVANQYIYNWVMSKSFAGTCRRLSVTLVDDTRHTALFRFTK